MGEKDKETKTSKKSADAKESKKADSKGKSDKKATKSDKKGEKAGGKKTMKERFAFMNKLKFWEKKKKDETKKPKEPKPKKPKTKKVKKEKKEEPKVPFIDEPSKVEKPSIYIHKVVKMDNKNSEFTDKQYQKVHELSKPSDVIESFHRIGMTLNNVRIADIPKDYCDKVCFILINNYKNESKNLGVGPLNDAYLFAKIHRKLGFKIAFLYNPDKLTFIKTLEFFLMHTMVNLTIFYAGRDSSSKQTRTSHGILFDGEQIPYSSTELGKLVGEKSNGQCKVLIISDCGSGGSIFNMKAATKTENAHCSTLVSFSTDKKLLEPKERRRTQGLFTYYFCKLIRQFPNSSPNEMVDILNQSFERFGMSFNSQLSSDDVGDQPIYPDANAIFNGPGSVPPQPPLSKPPEKPETETVTVPIPETAK